MRDLKSQTVAIKFQCMVHRGVCLSLRQQIKRLQSNSATQMLQVKFYLFISIFLFIQLYSKNKKDKIEEQLRLIAANKRSLNVKDDKYSKLMSEYIKLKKSYNSININEVKIENDVDRMLRSLKEDKENLQNVNKQLKEATNVYRFQSVAHKKVAQKSKLEKDKLKSQLIELLEQHAPNQEIKNMLKDNQNIENRCIEPKINIIPSNPQRLPSYSDIQTPKVQNTNNQEMENKLLEKENIIQQLQDELKQHEIIELKLNDENNDLIDKMEELHIKMKQMNVNKFEWNQEKEESEATISYLTNELSQIQSDTEKEIAYITMCAQGKIKTIMNKYEEKIKSVQNANDILKETVNQLNDKKSMFEAYMNVYKNKVNQYQNDKNKLIESNQEQIHDKELMIVTLENELKFKDQVIEELKQETMTEDQEYKDLKQKHELILKQCVTMSKLNESIQIENNQLLDEQIITDDKYQDLQININSIQQKYNKLSQSLFDRILISSCYKYKCQQLKKYVKILEKHRENAQTDLTVEQLKTLELNDEINELKQFKQESQSNETGLMLKSLEANNTIKQLLEENNSLKTQIQKTQIQCSQDQELENKESVKYCNDPSHDEKISSLQRKFGLMCLNIEKVQLESFEFVKKAMSLRDDNAKLKKQNRRITREMKHLQFELEELRSQSQSQWSLNESFVESIQSNHSIYYDEYGNSINLSEIKMVIENNFHQINDKQSKITTSTQNSINEIDQTLNQCMDKINDLKLKQMMNKQKEIDIKQAMSQIMSLSENVTNEIKQQFDGMLSLYTMRCDNITQNIRLIKHAMQSKKNEENQCKKEQQNKIEKYLYDLQFAIKIIKDTFKNEIIHNFKHSMKEYQEEYEQFQATICKAFVLTTKKYTEALKDKCDKIEQLEMLLFEKQDENENMLQVNKNHYDEMHSVNKQLQKELTNLSKERDEYKTCKLELENQNNALKQEVCKLEHVIETNKNNTNQKESKLDGLHEEKTQLMIKIKGLQDEMKQLENKLNLCESDKYIEKTKQEKQEKELLKLMKELEETKKLKNKYFNDKQLLQKEMKLMNKQLDELNVSKTHLLTQVEQMMEFQSNTLQLREKMEQYTQMTACNQQRIQQLESMKNTLEKDNVMQLEKMQKVFAENEAFKIENKQQRETINEMKVVISKQKEKMDELLATITCLQEEKDTVMIESVNKKNDIDKEKENKKYCDEIDKLQTMIDVQKLELISVQQEKEQLFKECNNLKENESEKENQFSDIYVKYAKQYDEIIELKAENTLLKDEMVSCDAQIDKLKHCIVVKLEKLNDKYNQKVFALKAANKIIVEKDEIIQELQEKLDVIQQNHCNEKSRINLKLDTLSLVISNKLIQFRHIVGGKDVEITELCDILTERNEEIFNLKQARSKAIIKLNDEVTNRLQTQDENEMLKELKHKLEEQVEELNCQLNALHAKHRMTKQSYDEINKFNKKIKEEIDGFKCNLKILKDKNAFIKHENEQIYRHRDHIKEKCDELQSRLIRYKDKFKTSYKECTLLRKKTTVLDQLLRLSDNQISSLQFDYKSSEVREKMLSDLIQKQNGKDITSLSKAYQAISLQLENITNNDIDQDDIDENHENDNQSIKYMQQRIDDLMTECDHYKEILMLTDQNNMDLKQQTALYTHQILENWQKIFDKLTSMINIKSYTIEILQKTVNDVIEINNNYKDRDFQVENKILNENIEEMKDEIRKLESKHRKEKIELKGLLDREVHLAHTQRDCMEKEVAVYRQKLQSFYRKYHRNKDSKEQKQLAIFIDNMRHEMSQLTQENVTMATVTNSLREIVRQHQDKTNKLNSKNESMYKDIYELCQYMQQISGETFLSQDEENIYNSTNIAEMVNAVKQKALSISSSRSSLHDGLQEDNDNNNNDDDDYDIIDINNKCKICQQEFNQMAWKYKCIKCNQHHCSLCAPIRDNINNEKEKKCRICHTCYE